MKRWLIAGVGAVVLGAGATWWLLGRSASEAPYRTASIDRGSITAAVRATGTLNPLTTVLVGSQLSGQVVEILADYNSPVKEGQVVARLFADQIRARRDAAAANVSDLKAQLGQREAQLAKARAVRTKAESVIVDLGAQRDRAAAQLIDAQRTNDRQKNLYERGAGAQATYDTARTQVDVQTATVSSVEAQIAAARADLSGLDADIALADAQVQSTRAQIRASQARLADAEIDLDHTDIRSPVNGVVVQRQVDLGQTVAASLAAPTLFTIAQDLREIDIWANVDESDVGRIREGQQVRFTVNAYPNRTFAGTVRQVRLGAQTLSNVVTYTTVVRVDNSDLALLPGMTANLQIITDERANVLRAPNAALRFKPAGTGEPSPPAAAAAGSGRGGGREMVRRLREEIASELQPTKDQSQAIDEAFADIRRSPAIADPSLSQPERRAAFSAMRETLVQRISAALDPERRKSFAAILARLKAEREASRSGTGAPGRVFVVDADGTPKPVPVVIGITDGTMTEVISGDIAEGTQVIVGGGPRPAANPAQGPRPGPPRGPRLF